METVENRHIVYNQTLSYIDERERQGEVLVIRPEESLNIGKVEKNPDKLQEVYEAGRSIAESRIDEIREYLNK